MEATISVKIPDRVRTAELLQRLSDQELHLVLSKASVREVPKGATLFRQEEPARQMFLLESGRVRLHELTAEGHELLVRFVVPGEVFGDKAAVARSEYGASAQASQTSRVISWTSSTMQELLEVERLASNLVAIMARYLHYSRERHQLLATVQIERRVGWALLELARSIGRREGNATVIKGVAIQKDVADLADTTIYSVSRVLGDLQRQGVLTKVRGRILLRRKEGLAALAGI
jgi:CRP-like cAMP-binding protein